MTKQTEIGIIEMGANHQGEIKRLCEIAAPNYGLITNIGKAHLEGFGSFEGVQKAKAELYSYLEKNNGLIFVNADNQILMNLIGQQHVVAYGSDELTHCAGKFIDASPFVTLKWARSNPYSNTKVDWHDGAKFIESKLIGKYNYENILAAICIGDDFGVEPEAIRDAIKSYRPVNNRSQLQKTNKNTLLIDLYNANPSSMKAALETLNSFDDQKHKLAILGDMLELGESSAEEHKNIIKYLKKNNLKTYLIGNNFFELKEYSNIQSFKNRDAFIIWLKENPIEGSLILVKGSRGIRLEKIIEYL